jgi:hypothetical protein
MRKRVTAKSAFYDPRILLGFFLCLVGTGVALIAFTMYSSPSALALNPADNAANSAKAETVALIGPVLENRNLRALPYIAPEKEQEERRLMRYPRTQSQGIPDPIRAVKKISQPIAMPSPIATFDGMNAVESGCDCTPPDTHGDVGPNHYIQSVNSSIKIFDKSGEALNGNRGTTYNSFFAALGSATPCGRNQNRGDGFVFYDQIASRWVVSDFAFDGGLPGTGPFYQCIGVSKSADPVAGGWYLYALQVDPSNPTWVGDYPKLGMWPDAYYLSANVFDATTLRFKGVRLYALPRAAMISGAGAPNLTAVAFTIPQPGLGDAYSLVPATYRAGLPPPAGRSEYFLAIDSPAAADLVQNKVKVWQFHVDFATPANSTLGVGPNRSPNGLITVKSFVDAFTATTNVVPQPGTADRLDPLGDKLMTPVVYLNHRGTESLWAAHTVNNNQNGTGPTGIRWYQFDVTGGTIPATAAQQQTFNNRADGLWRFMPSIAVDGNGNMAIGYNASSNTNEPSIRYTGRLAGDRVSTLGLGEVVLIDGAGHQTDNGRWGDYGALSIDPTDNLTFWQTHEYYAETSSSSWSTRIGAFKFPSAPVAIRAVSRKTHGTAGDFNIVLSGGGTPGIENRVGPVAGQHKIVVTFEDDVTLSSASITSGSGRVDNFSVSGTQVTVNLSGVANAQTVTINLGNVTDGVNTGDMSISMSVLAGDTTGNGAVSSSDVSQTRLHAGQSVTSANFRTDINTNGLINATDVSLVKSNSGTALP